MTSPEQIVTQARSWLGTKYHHQGRLKKNNNSMGGVDCIGLIIGVASELKIKSITGKLLSDYDETNYSFYPDGVSLKRFLDKHLYNIEKTKIQSGDVLLFKFFSDPQHVGIASNYEATNYIVANKEYNTQNSLNKNTNSQEPSLIHCYSGSGKVVEHLITPAWQKMLVAGYRFYSI